MAGIAYSNILFSRWSFSRTGERRAGRPRSTAGAGQAPRQARGTAADPVVPQPRGQEGEAGARLGEPEGMFSSEDGGKRGLKNLRSIRVD